MTKKTTRKTKAKKQGNHVDPNPPVISGMGVMLWLRGDNKAGVIQITTGTEDTQTPVAEVAMDPENLEKLAGQLIQLSQFIKTKEQEGAAND